MHVATVVVQICMVTIDVYNNIILFFLSLLHFFITFFFISPLDYEHCPPLAVMSTSSSAPEITEQEVQSANAPNPTITILSTTNITKKEANPLLPLITKEEIASITKEDASDMKPNETAIAADLLHCCR